MLASERWLSIDLYRDALVREFAAGQHGVQPAILGVNPNPDATWPRRQFDFHVGLPRRLRHAASDRPVVHFLDQNYAWFCRSSRLRQAFRSVVTCHDLAPLKQRSLAPHRLSRYAARVRGMLDADAVVSVSAHTARDVIELGVEPSRIHVNPPGVDAAFRPMPRDTAISRLPLPEGGPWVLHVGSNDFRKNLPLLLHAMATLRRRIPGARLLKIGPALKESAHRRLIARLGLGEAIVELGRVDLPTLIAAYNRADILALPSSYEGFGRPLLEAMACGTPCVAAHATALPEVAGTAALYHEPDDAAGLAECLQHILEDRRLRRCLAAAGPERAAGFTWAAHAARLAEIYRSV